MRYQFNDKDDETNSHPSGLSIWSTTNLQMPNILKCINNPNGSDVNADELSNTCTLDSVTQSHKRKILDCEKEDFEERLRKIQRKKQLQRITAKANLIVDDEEYNSDFDDEDKIYEQMDWIERENDAMTLHTWENNEDDDFSFEDIKTSIPLMCLPRFKWREERRRLLKISMAKIRGVEDPEAYLRRSVLINNTVKRLQKDGPVNYRCHSVASSFSQGNAAFQNESIGSWAIENAASNVCRQVHSDASVGFKYSSVLNNDATVHFNDPNVQSDVSYNSLNFHLSFASAFSSDKPHDASQLRSLQSSPPAFYSKISIEEQKSNDSSISSRTLKQLSPIHVFSTQPCGLQYRNPVHGEDSNNEYHESNSSSSILDSVVYHSLIASLES